VWWCRQRICRLQGFDEQIICRVRGNRKGYSEKQWSLRRRFSGLPNERGGWSLDNQTRCVC